MDGTARNRSPEVDEAIRFLSHSMLQNLSDIISKSSLYSLMDEWPEMYMFYFQRARHPPVFATLLESATKALNIVRSLSPQVEVMKLDEDGPVIMPPDSQTALLSA